MRQVRRDDVAWLRGCVGSCPECGRLVGLWRGADGEVVATDWTQDGLNTLRVEWADSITMQGAAISHPSHLGHSCAPQSSVGGLGVCLPGWTGSAEDVGGGGSTGNGPPLDGPA